MEDGVSAKPSASSGTTTVVVRATCGGMDVASSSPPLSTTCWNAEGEALKALENAIDNGDTHTVCNLLQLLRKQYAQKERKNWPPDTVRLLWSEAVRCLRDGGIPEVGARACQVIEVLAQNCKSCVEGDWESVFHDEAPKQVIRAMEKHPSDLSVQSSALRALLSMSGCMMCRSFYDAKTQDLMGRSNAVSALVRALNVLQQLTTKMQFETNAHKLARLAIADAVQTLHYICLVNKGNIAELASLKGLCILETSIEDNLNELTVQEHGCMLMAELVTSGVLTEQEILECVSTVTNVARLQMQEKYSDMFIEVARAAVWSLARVASNTLHPCSRHSSGSSCTVALNQTWCFMQEQMAGMIMGMMQSCQLKSDPLVKHCLDFIAVVGGGEGCSAPSARMLENFARAKELVYELFTEADDIRIKAVSLRTLCALASNPHATSTDTSISVETLLEDMRTARNGREALCKDVLCIQMFGLTLISHVGSMKGITRSVQISRYIQDVHEAIGYVIRYIVDGGENFCDSSDIEESTVENRDILGAVAGVAAFLSLWGRDGVNSVDERGCTVLHKLAEYGMKDCLGAFLEACGKNLDYSKRTPDGADARSLARASRDHSCVLLIEEAMETAAKRLQAALLRDVEEKEGNASKYPILPHEQRNKMGPMSDNDERGRSIDLTNIRDADALRQSATEQKEAEKQKEEEEYERALAERRKQLEDMQAVTRRRTPSNRGHHYEERQAAATRNRENSQSSALWSLSDANSQSAKNSSRFLGTERDMLPYSTSGEGTRTIGLSTGSDVQRHQSLLGTSASVGSVANNGSPDPAAAPAGAYDDRIVDSSLSAFQARDHRLALGLHQGDDTSSSTWHSLFAADSNDASHGGMDNKWSMMSSSSAQNNHTLTDGDRHSNFIQQPMWALPSNQAQGQGPQQHGPSPASYESETAELPSGFIPRDAKKGVADEDGVDDTQILSWLSSEITGLIGNGSPPNSSTAEMKKARDFRAELVPPPPPPPPQNPPPFDNADDGAGLVSMNQFMSPFYAGNMMGPSQCMSQSPGNFVHSHSTPWRTGGQNSVTMDPRLVPQSEINNGDGRSVAPSGRFWHTEENDVPSKHLWLGNLNTRLPRSVLKSVFEEYGPIEDVVTFPGRMYAFVNFIQPEDAQRAAKELDNLILPVLTGNRKLVVKFRPNRKALGRVGDLMPGVANIEECGGGAMAPSISVPVFRSPDMSSQQSGTENNAPVHPHLTEGEHHHPHERHVFGERDDAFEASEPSALMGTPCRHLWLGNVCVRPSKTVLFSLFSRYGPVDSVRVFPGKTYAFVNFYGGEHACRAKEALDGKVLAAITGTKPLVVRFQREGSGPAGWSRMQESLSNIPPLQSVESAPGAYAPNNILSPGRVTMGRHGDYGSESHRTPSLSPEDRVPLSHPMRTAPDTSVYDVFQNERRQRLQASEQEVMWPEGAVRETCAPGHNTSSSAGVYGDQLGSVHNSAAIEASSIGHLTRTLSAATFGKGQHPSPYARAPPLDRNSQWNTAMLSGAAFEQQVHQSSYSASLNPSHSFGGYDGKGYCSPFFHPQMAPGNNRGMLASSHSWVSPSADSQRPLDSVTSATANLSPDQRAAVFTSAMPSQAGYRSYEVCGDDAILHQALAPQLYVASGVTSMTPHANNVDLMQGQQWDGHGIVPSVSAISCDKGGL